MSNQSGIPKSYFRIGVFIIAILLVLGGLTDWIVEWLWLGNLGHEQVFWTIKTAQILLFVCAFVLALLYVIPNMNLLGKKISRLSFGPSSPLAQLNIQDISPKKIRGVFILLGAVISIFFALAFFSQWDSFFRYIWSEPFGKTDPLFSHDIGFYIFRLPVLDFLQNSLVALVFFVTVITIIVYIYTGALSIHPDRTLSATTGVKKQISMNLGTWLLLLSWGYYLQRYDLLNNSQGVVYGAGYVDVNINLPVIWILCICCFLLALLTFFQLYKSKFKWLLTGGIAVIVIGIAGRLLLPVLVQQFYVEPNELQLEKPYLKHNISQTRNAFALDSLHVKNYDAKETLNWQQIQKNEPTIKNIRLWDPRLLIRTYRQLQEIRSYYQFYNVDVDRYHTSDGYLQMMLSARELSSELPDKADTWVNRRLQYTHGYGLVMSPVAQQGIQGDPKLTIKDLPPVSKMGLDVKQAAVYYGVHNSDYKIVNTDVKELDYPKGDQNVYTNYAGTGGISIDNFFEKLLFAWQFGDINILLSDYIRDGSKIIFWKTIRKRVHKVAPFLRLEQKPYLTLSNGKLYWILDAYMTSSRYPYSEPNKNQDFNYIRNSVKVVVDAYNGSVKLYAIDDSDPILKTYQNIFPNLFEPLSALSPDLKKHLRYPQILFSTQIEKYNKYHMTDPQVFYNNEDLWTQPSEKYGGTKIKMEPYYLLSKLPGQDTFQYLLISPLTPKNRDNMIAWVAAKSDFPEYGNVAVFKLPKERLILGPAQIEAKIDQDTEISRQLSLWDQRGSQVTRGNLMIVPIEDSFLYVEPVFLTAQGVNIPQLQRVIATDGDKIAMEPTLQEAVKSVFGKKGPTPILSTKSASDTTIVQKVVAPQMKKIRQLWEEASSALRAGDWQKFGDKMKQIDQQVKEK